MFLTDREKKTTNVDENHNYVAGSNKAGGILSNHVYQNLNWMSHVQDKLHSRLCLQKDSGQTLCDFGIPNYFTVVEQRV